MELVLAGPSNCIAAAMQKPASYLELRGPTISRRFLRSFPKSSHVCPSCRRLADAMATTTSAAAASPAPEQQPPARKAVRVVVKGRVQGVGFRDWTAEMAESLGLAGWVRNRRGDGTVEALLSGDPAKVDEMVSRRLPVGPPAAGVTAVVASPADPVHPSLGFEIKLTV